ncbi:uncharacterized protein LOC109607482 [Aethina tumida]|uniref:uncharacterized protein LOC109607482 n=1 Tax=Aethina tumida TaxID=116153 RepID=UPI0021475896|nr:uncharacterized protein LOC109607482 [Aethina tumida]
MDPIRESEIPENIKYFKSRPGLLKLAQLILGIICASLYSNKTVENDKVYFKLVSSFLCVIAIICCIKTIFWMVIYWLNVKETKKLTNNWTIIEFINTTICATFYTIACIEVINDIIAFAGMGTSAWIAHWIFGVFNTLIFWYSVYLLWFDTAKWNMNICGCFST